MVYDASFWHTQRNWSALTGALTGAATRRDYLGMLRHIEAVRAAGMPEDRIRRAYADVASMVPSVPAFEVLEQVAHGRVPEPASAPPAATAATDPAARGGSSTVAEPAPTFASPPGDAAFIGNGAATVPAPDTDQAEPGGRGTVQQLDYWLSVLRDGDDTRKIEARGNLSVIFEQRGLFTEAIEMLEGNAWAGVSDAAAQRRLAGLYRQIGRQDLADKAISDLYQFGMSSGPTASAPASVVSGVMLPGTREAAPTTTIAATTAAEPVPEAPVPAPAWRRPRPVWLTISLTMATFGLYAFYWLFATWRELKRESGDTSMHPFWHMLGIAIVPIYGWIRFYAHMRTIRAFGTMAGAASTLSPGLCVWLFILTAVVNRVTIRFEP
jgi:hypothetical protein